MEKSNRIWRKFIKKVDNAELSGGALTVRLERMVMFKVYFKGDNHEKMVL